MTDLADVKNLIQVEETRFRAAVSESTLQRIGQTANFINNRNHQEKNWYINGPYNITGGSDTFVDGMTFLWKNALIVDIFMFVEIPGSGGTTELDIKYSTTPGGSFTSIFSTRPKIQSTAGTGVWIHIGSSVPNTTAPVLSVTQLDANWGLRMDLISAQSGAPAGAGILMLYQPR